MNQWLVNWITNSEVSDAKTVEGSMVGSVYHPSMKETLRTPEQNLVVKSKLFP